MKTTVEQIERLLDERVRPSLNAHGGDVEIRGLDGGVLKVRLLGQCSGCPAAHTTNEEIISTEVTERFPDITDVILIEETSPELLDFARKLLRREIKLD